MALNPGQFCSLFSAVPRRPWSHLETFGLHNWRKEGAAGIWQVEARDAGKHLIVHRTPHHNKNCSTQSVTKPKLRNPGLVGFFNCKMSIIIISIKTPFLLVRDLHQHLCFSCSDAPQPGFFCPGQDLLGMSKGYNSILRRRQIGL